MDLTSPPARDRIAPPPSGKGLAGITVGEALELPALARARLRAGQAGLDRRIRSVNMMEVPDISRWLREDELLVTTAYPLREGAGALGDLLRLLARYRLAGVALKTGRYLHALPRDSLELADRLALPLIELTPDASFNDILAEVLGTILNRQAFELERSNMVHERLTAVVLAGGGLPDVVDAFVELTGCDAAIVDAAGVVLAASRPPAELDAQGLLRVTRTLRAGGVRYGTLTAFSPQPRIPRTTMLAMEHAVTIAALTLVHTRAVAGRARRSRVSLAEELLAGRLVRPEQARARAQALGWDLSRPRAALLATLSGNPQTNGQIPDQPSEDDLVRTLATVAGPDAIGWSRSAGLASLIVADSPHRPGRIAAELRSALERGWPGTSVAVGAGRSYTDLGDLTGASRRRRKRWRSAADCAVRASRSATTTSRSTGCWTRSPPTSSSSSAPRPSVRSPHSTAATEAPCSTPLRRTSRTAATEPQRPTRSAFTTTRCATGWPGSRRCSTIASAIRRASSRSSSRCTPAGSSPHAAGDCGLSEPASPSQRQPKRKRDAGAVTKSSQGARFAAL